MDNYFDMVAEIKKRIQIEVEQGHKEFAIYPFGVCGALVKDILETYFDIKPYMIIDNYVSKYNPNIKSLEKAICELRGRGFTILLTALNTEIVESIRYTAYKYLESEHIVDLFPNVQGDLRVEWLRKFSGIVYKENIIGNGAECGVYRGDFAKYVNEFFPDRKCYLFDSFEGFCERDLKIEYEKNPAVYETESSVGSIGTWLRDTSVEVVLNKMPYPHQVCIKQGYIPSTFEGLDESFCFVNLDVDLYNPAYEGLKFFYPRMVTGGVILLHDCYDYRKKHIVEQAVYDYEECIGTYIHRIPAADKYSLAIIKM